MVNSINGNSYRRLESNLDVSDEDEIELNGSVHQVRNYKTAVTNLKKTRKVQRILVFIFVIMVFFCLYLPLSQNIYRPRVVAIPGWSFNTSRETTDYILPDDNTTLLEPVNLCVSLDGRKLFLLIVVCSSLNNFDQR